jgi:hypothetical protein
VAKRTPLAGCRCQPCNFDPAPYSFEQTREYTRELIATMLEHMFAMSCLGASTPMACTAWRLTRVLARAPGQPQQRWRHQGVGPRRPRRGAADARTTASSRVCAGQTRIKRPERGAGAETVRQSRTAADTGVPNVDGHNQRCRVQPNRGVRSVVSGQLPVGRTVRRAHGVARHAPSRAGLRTRRHQNSREAMNFTAANNDSNI